MINPEATISTFIVSIIHIRIDTIKVDIIASGFITPAEARLLMVYARTSKY